MNQPSNALLTELAQALQEAAHPNVAEHFVAGLLWAMYPQWFEESKIGPSLPKNKMAHRKSTPRENS